MEHTFLFDGDSLHHINVSTP